MEEIYSDHAPAAFRLAYLLTGNREVAGDLVQEAFARALGRFAHLRGDEVIGAYLRRTVVNRANSYFRRRAVERKFVEGRPAEAPAASSLDRVEERHDLVAAVRRLPARQRAALALRYFEDLTEEQAADVLGTTPKAVNSLVNRALNSLRGQGGEDAEG